MKLAKLTCCTLLLITFFTFTQCKKKDEPQLPPETTIGAMSFGCKVNGEIILPKDGNGKQGLKIEYVNLGDGVGGGWFLNINSYDYQKKKGIHIETDSLLLIEGIIYGSRYKKGYPLIWYEQVVDGTTRIYAPQENDSNILYIKKHDLVKRIISGTFSFAGTRISTGEKVTVTDGKFDLRY